MGKETTLHTFPYRRSKIDPYHRSKSELSAQIKGFYNVFPFFNKHLKQWGKKQQTTYIVIGGKRKKNGKSIIGTEGNNPPSLVLGLRMSTKEDLIFESMLNEEN